MNTLDINNITLSKLEKQDAKFSYLFNKDTRKSRAKLGGKVKKIKELVNIDFNYSFKKDIPKFKKGKYLVINLNSLFNNETLFDKILDYLGEHNPMTMYVNSEPVFIFFAEDVEGGRYPVYDEKKIVDTFHAQIVCVCSESIAKMVNKQNMYLGTLCNLKQNSILKYKNYNLKFGNISVITKY